MDLLKQSIKPAINEVRMKTFILLFSLGIGLSGTADAYISKARKEKERLACKASAISSGVAKSFSCDSQKCTCTDAAFAAPGGEIFPPGGGPAPKINKVN